MTHSKRFAPGPLGSLPSNALPVDVYVYVRFNGGFTPPELIHSHMSGWTVQEDSARHGRWHGDSVTWLDVLTNKISVDRSSVGNALYLVLNLAAGSATESARSGKKNFADLERLAVSGTNNPAGNQSLVQAGQQAYAQTYPHNYQQGYPQDYVHTATLQPNTAQGAYQGYTQYVDPAYAQTSTVYNQGYVSGNPGIEQTYNPHYHGQSQQGYSGGQVYPVQSYGQMPQGQPVGHPSQGQSSFDQSNTGYTQYPPNQSR